MSYDNRIFNVNGESDGDLLGALKLVFAQENTTCKGWMFKPTHGLILLWWADEGQGVNKFPAPLTAEECFIFVKSWLKSEDAAKVEMKDWDADADHDGHNEMGWRVYCEDWGHVANRSDAICAVKPIHCWYGK